MEIRNAKIEGTTLGLEDHGIPTSYLTLNYGSSAQGFGGYDLRKADSMLKWVMGIQGVLGVDDWSKVKGQVCRARIEEHLVRAIGHIIEDRWFEADSIYK